MPFPLAAIAGAAIPAVASWLGGRQANRSNQEMAQQQMAFQERMSGSAYQRATEDMRLSGINPMLAYMQGGASTPGGAMPTMQDVISPAVSSAQHGRRLSAELKNMWQQSMMLQQQRFESEARQELTLEQKLGQNLQNKILEFQIPAARNQAASEQNMGGVRRTIRDWREAIFGGGIVAPFRIGGGR